jgi:hypothetical protein
MLRSPLPPGHGRVRGECLARKLLCLLAGQFVQRLVEVVYTLEGLED